MDASSADCQKSQKAYNELADRINKLDSIEILLVSLDIIEICGTETLAESLY